MARPEVTPIDLAREFNVDELFFSVTDKKGVIQSGNSVFVRVSGFAEHELIGEPHNIIRHKDTPRCVFRLLWDYLDAGKPIAAYVKNMAKTGEYYWVIAVVAPIADGYLSVRFKPTSPLLDLIKGVYQELCEIEERVEANEHSRKQAMDASTARLVEILHQHGFESYDEFMFAFLPEELKRRAQLTAEQQGANSKELRTRSNASSVEQYLTEIRSLCSEVNLHLEQLFAGLDEFVNLNAELRNKSAFVLNLAKAIRALALNASIASTRIGKVGATLGTVSEILGDNSEHSARIIRSLNESISPLMGRLQRVSFSISMSKLQVDMTKCFVDELLKEWESEQGCSEDSMGRLRNEMGVLVEGFEASSGGIFTLLNESHRGLEQLTEEVEQLTKIMRTLELVHFTGKVEAARITEAEGFGSILEQVLELILSAKNEMGAFSLAIRKILKKRESFHESRQAVDLLTGKLKDSVEIRP